MVPAVFPELNHAVMLTRASLRLSHEGLMAFGIVIQHMESKLKRGCLPLDLLFYPSALFIGELGAGF